MVGKGKSIIVASRGKKPELLAEGLVSDSSSSRPCDEKKRISKTVVVLYIEIHRRSIYRRSCNANDSRIACCTTYSAPKLGIIAPSNHSSLTVWSQCCSHEVESADQFLTVCGVQSIFWSFAHGDDEDVAIVAVES
jgi:hypothetical protein